MRKLMAAAPLLMLVWGGAFSQTRREPVGWISFFTGGGGISGAGPTVDSLGVDTTFRIYKGLGAGGGSQPGWDFGSSGTFVIFSGNLSYHFRRLDKIGPFVTGGYSTVFRKATREDGGNFGAGFEYWFRDHMGLHAEFRNQIFTGTAREFYGFRVGMAMR